MEHSSWQNSPCPRWRKVAYGGMQPGFDDNHTDESFLEDMVMNANVVKRDMLKVLLDSVSISQYLALVGLVWTYTLQSTLNENSLLLLDVSLFGSGIIVLVLTEEMLSLNPLFHYILNVSFFTTELYVLAPTYHILTRSISSDSIWAVAFSLIILHLFLHDYSGSTIRTARVLKNPNLTSCVSLNASVVASVFIASRLPSRLHVFALMLFSLQSLSICPVCDLLYQEILLPVAPSVFIWVDGCHLGIRIYISPVTFRAVIKLTGVCECGLSLLAY